VEGRRQSLDEGLNQHGLANALLAADYGEALAGLDELYKFGQ
jgi:hypothetical protein